MFGWLENRKSEATTLRPSLAALSLQTTQPITHYQCDGEVDLRYPIPYLRKDFRTTNWIICSTSPCVNSPGRVFEWYLDEYIPKLADVPIVWGVLGSVFGMLCSVQSWVRDVDGYNIGILGFLIARVGGCLYEKVSH